MAPPTKMLIMLPLMFAARKLDGEDPDIIFMLRCAYFTVQFFIVLSCLYVFLQAQKIASSKFKELTIYVAPPPSPFGDQEKKQYKEVKFGPHCATTARQLLTSTFFGIVMTSGLHWYKGMIVGLAMQSVMGPLNFLENKFAKALLFGGALKDGETPKSRNLFDEKYREDITKDDEIIDEKGDVVSLRKKEIPAATAPKKTSVSFEDLLLDTWDEGEKADVGPLVAALTAKNANFKTKENGWTPLMILVALGAEKCGEAIKKLKDVGANANIVDGEGWNALHWAAFHGSASGAKNLLDVFGTKSGLQDVKDKEGKTPLKHANAEGNADVAKVIEEATTGAGDSGLADKDGLRKRK